MTEHRTDSKLTTYVDNVGDGHPGVVDVCVKCGKRWPCPDAPIPAGEYFLRTGKMRKKRTERTDTERLDWLAGEMEYERAHRGYRSLFRRNTPITRVTIDAAMEDSPDAAPE